MTRTIILDDVRIYEWTVDLIRQCVNITCDIIDSEGNAWISGKAIFWETIPQQTDPDGNPVPPADNWYQLPAEHSSLLVSLTQDARNALIASLL
jgi:hypothetical protein